MKISVLDENKIQIQINKFDSHEMNQYHRFIDNGLIHLMGDRKFSQEIITVEGDYTHERIVHIVRINGELIQTDRVNGFLHGVEFWKNLVETKFGIQVGDEPFTCARNSGPNWSLHGLAFGSEVISFFQFDDPDDLLIFKLVVEP
jgi:hypothetical protein